MERRCTEAIELSPGGPVVALNIPIGQWHTVRALESGTAIMEVKDGPYEPHGAGGYFDSMTQEERWNKSYQDVMDFMEKNHRNPSRHRLEEHDMLNWLKQQRKLKNKGELKAERAEMLERLLSLWEEYKRVNQWG